MVILKAEDILEIKVVKEECKAVIEDRPKATILFGLIEIQKAGLYVHDRKYNPKEITESCERVEDKKIFRKPYVMIRSRGEGRYNFFYKEDLESAEALAIKIKEQIGNGAKMVLILEY